jgi:methyltransferase family protein
MGPKTSRPKQPAAATDHGASWSDYWVNDGVAGEVFVNHKGERHPALAEYWQQQFAGLKEAARVIDLASGAGSIYAHLPAGRGFELHAVDVSCDALEILLGRIPGTTTVVCSVDEVPYGDQMFDLVVSQFGVEYAGPGAFSEAARLVASGGRLDMLCHYADGYIDSRNQELLAGANVAKNSGFIEKAIDLIDAAFSQDSNAQRRTANAFVAAEKTLAQAAKNQQRGIDAHLYLGFRRLYERRSAYSKDDITTWLKQMHDEIDKNIDRLTRMCEAALSREDMEQVCKRFVAQGLQSISCSPFHAPGSELPIAWELTAVRA